MKTHRHQPLPRSMYALTAVLAAVCVFQAFGTGRTTQIVIEPAVIATVDIERIFRTIDLKAKTDQRLEAFARRLDDQSKVLLEEIEMLEADLEAFAPGAPNWDRANADLLQKTFEFQGFVQFAGNRLELEQGDALREIYYEIRRVTAELADQHGYDVVFVDDTIGELGGNTKDEVSRQISARRMLHINRRALDISDQVIAAMNSQL